ncbi:hypothetical protein Cgig2_004830 [Carnegiea gigantea]|uniref:Chlororespiratory reduction 4 n=1 Tax=Carnegiea gigantea TaxID=171969 RepID=A0A9Q1QPG5_9CARY|nr:hypothetical protein Cgig2_004830 [Carnegiea gigantea]
MSNTQSLYHLIRDCLSKRAPREALVLHSQIRRQGECVVLSVVPLLIKACASLSMFNHGKALHAESVKSGSDSDVVVATSVLGMYAKRGDIVDARKVFDFMPQRNVVSWNAMISGYLAGNDTLSALSLFESMPERSAVTWNEMIRGFTKIGDMAMAKALFDEVPHEMRTVVTWTVMVDGYASNGDMKAAREVFEEMPERNYFVWSLGMWDVGKEVHLSICEKGITPNQYVLNGLVDMYAKCGDLATARSIFEGMPQINGVCWNSIISGFAIHGKCREAVDLFRQMEHAGVKPNEITFLSVLSACAHGGLVQEGLDIFSKMHKYGVTAGIKHYGCIIDLLGRAGRLKEAFDLVKSLPMRPNATIWGSLLGACRLHSEATLAEEAMDDICHTGSSSDSYYSLLSNIYAAQERWEKAEETRMSMLDKGLEKIPGSSSCTLNGGNYSL